MYDWMVVPGKTRAMDTKQKKKFFKELSQQRTSEDRYLRFKDNEAINAKTHLMREVAVEDDKMAKEEHLLECSLKCSCVASRDPEYLLMLSQWRKEMRALGLDGKPAAGGFR